MYVSYRHVYWLKMLGMLRYAEYQKIGFNSEGELQKTPVKILQFNIKLLALIWP